MQKVQNIFLLLIFAGILYNCNEKHHQDKPDLIKSISGPGNWIDTTLDHGMTPDAEYEKYPREKLKPIIEAFIKINSTKNWTDVKEVDLDGSTEGGSGTYYFEAGELKKIITRLYGETGKSIKEYYFQQNKLIFVYETEYKYNRPVYFDSVKMKEFNDTEVFDENKSEIFEDRSYFENDILIHQSNNQDCGSPFAESYLMDEQKRIKGELVRLTKLVTTKN